MDSAIENRDRIIALDGLRGIAILSVVFCHSLGYSIIFNSSAPKLILALQSVARYGWIGVDLFFVLSGFLITRNLLIYGGTSSYLRTFYLKRIWRIVPPYYGALVVVFLARALLMKYYVDVPAGLYNFKVPLYAYSFFVSNVPLAALEGSESALLRPYWSLALEAQFYLVIPLLVGAASRRTVAAVICSGVLLAPLFRLIGILLFPHSDFAVYALLPFRLDAFFMGGGIALLDMSDEARRHPMLRLATSRLVLMSLFSLSTILLWNTTAATPRRCVIGYSATALTCAVLVTAVMGPGYERMRAMLSAFPLRFLGLISYSLYLLHHPLQDLIIYGFDTARLDWMAQVSVFLASLGFAFLFASLYWRVIEYPCCKKSKEINSKPVPNEV